MLSGSKFVKAEKNEMLDTLVEEIEDENIVYVHR